MAAADQGRQKKYTKQQAGRNPVYSLAASDAAAAVGKTYAEVQTAASSTLLQEQQPLRGQQNHQQHVKIQQQQQQQSNTGVQQDLRRHNRHLNSDGSSSSSSQTASLNAQQLHHQTCRGTAVPKVQQGHILCEALRVGL